MADDRSASHDGVIPFLVHDVDPKGIAAFITLTPRLLEKLNHCAKGLVRQPQCKLLQTPNDKLSCRDNLSVIGMDIKKVDRRDESKLRSGNDEYQRLNAKGSR